MSQVGPAIVQDLGSPYTLEVDPPRQKSTGSLEMELYNAVLNGISLEVEQLIADSVDIDVDDHIFSTPLHFSEDAIIHWSIFNHPENQKSRLLELVNFKNESGQSALQCAANNRFWDIACTLILHGADIRTMTHDDMYILLRHAADKTHSAYYRQYHAFRPVVGLLAMHVPHSFHDFSDDYYYPRALSHFCAYGHTLVVDAILNAIIDSHRRTLLATSPDNGTSPINHLLSVGNFCDADCLRILKYVFSRGIRHGLLIKVDNRYLIRITIYLALNGHLESLKYMLQTRFLQSCTPTDYMSFFYRALEHNRMDVVKYLLTQTSADIHTKDSHQKTLLHHAAEDGHLNSVKYLVEECNFKLNDEDSGGNSALNFAINNKQWLIVEYLVKKGAQISASTRKLQMWYVLYFQNPSSCHPDRSDSQGRSRLHLAIQSNNICWAEFLIQEGANINLVDRDGRTPLHYAMEQGNFSIAKDLLTRGGIYDSTDSHRRKPINLVINSDSWVSKECCWIFSLIDKLFKSKNLMDDLEDNVLNKQDCYGLDEHRFYPDAYDSGNPMQFILSTRNSKGQSLLHVAANNNDTPASQFLLNFNDDCLAIKNENLFSRRYDHMRGFVGIDIDATDCDGNTALHKACEHSVSIEFVSLLLKKGCMFDLKNNNKNTPLMLAQLGKSELVVNLLMCIGSLFSSSASHFKITDFASKYDPVICVRARDCAGKTLLHVAYQKGLSLAIEWLLLHGADINAIDNMSETPLHTGVNYLSSIVLLERGAKYCLKNKRLQTPLAIAKNPISALVLWSVTTLFTLLQSSCSENRVADVFSSLPCSTECMEPILNARDEDGNTLLHHAARANKLGIAQLLLKFGAKFDEINNQGQTPLKLTTDAMLIKLLQFVNDWFTDGGREESPFRYPIFGTEVIRADPIKLGIIKNARNSKGETPLHIITNIFRVKFLLENKIDTSVKDCHGATPLDRALERNDNAVAKLLKEVQ